MDDGVKYPNCTVELTGVNGSAVAIFMKVARELTRYLVEQEGMDRGEARQIAERFKGEATSGDYDNVLATCFRWVNVI